MPRIGDSLQERQKAALDPLAARADSILERKRWLAEHQQAFAALGKATAEAMELAKSERERSLVIEDLRAQLARIADDARTLFDATRADDFPEIARESDSLNKRITALRQRLLET